MGAVIEQDGLRTYYDNNGNIVMQELASETPRVLDGYQPPAVDSVQVEGNPRYTFDRGFFNSNEQQKKQLKKTQRELLRDGIKGYFNKYERDFLYPKNEANGVGYSPATGYPEYENISNTSNYVIHSDGTREDYGLKGQAIDWPKVPNVSMQYPVTRSQYAWPQKPQKQQVAPSAPNTSKDSNAISEERTKALMQLIMKGVLGTGNAARLAAAKERGYSDLEYAYARQMVNEYFRNKGK
jgi:hypothetical protein